MKTTSVLPELFHKLDAYWYGPTTVVPATGASMYTCPMHREVQQDHPGNCPKCGMALEPMAMTVGTDEEENTELHDMTMRFRVAATLTVPVFILAMVHIVPVLGNQPWVESQVSRWIQFALTTLVVGWAGWPFFQRGWRSVIHLARRWRPAAGCGRDPAGGVGAGEGRAARWRNRTTEH